MLLVCQVSTTYLLILTCDYDNIYLPRPYLLILCPAWIWFLINWSDIFIYISVNIHTSSYIVQLFSPWTRDEFSWESQAASTSSRIKKVGGLIYLHKLVTLCLRVCCNLLLRGWGFYIIRYQALRICVLLFSVLSIVLFSQRHAQSVEIKWACFQWLSFSHWKDPSGDGLFNK